MTPYQVTEDLLVQDQGFRTNTDVDSDDPDLSSEEERSPEPEESIQGPSTGFSGRGPQNTDLATLASASKKDQNNISLPQISEPRQTNIPPPEKKPNPANYSGTDNTTSYIPFPIFQLVAILVNSYTILGKICPNVATMATELVLTNSTDKPKYSTISSQVKVPKGGWNDMIFAPVIKQILSEYINEPDPDTTEDILQHPNSKDYAFSCKGKFYVCNCISDALFLVLERSNRRKGGTLETDRRRYVEGKGDNIHTSQSLQLLQEREETANNSVA
ncbi:hypothetical protein DFJ58DRAFT_912662 [Suillus subalutaceus]|uniref:uncharacterized protein n=1 Tax=Suillus subalutaceus TaxID=48586 RepID=UPI001B880FD5|nr:uncharacterized protein DFJ58DRAFT_912662 [Suillus subalutaceus]KAG1862113.1 hypothetical protein DFJ58DRAFT_912662 [Suillus subalutaceus]